MYDIYITVRYMRSYKCIAIGGNIGKYTYRDMYIYRVDQEPMVSLGEKACEDIFAVMG